MSSRVAVATAAVAFMGAALFASAQQPVPTFRSEVSYVQLPVRVLDRNGNFVRDLKASDFQISEDGQLQTISNFRLIDYPAPKASAAAVDTVGTGPMTVDKLEQLNGRVYMFLIDDYHVGIQHSVRAKDIVRRFIRERMAPNDVGALMMTSGAKGQDFTADKRLLLSGLDRFNGVLDTNEPFSVLELKARSVVKMIGDVAGALGQIHDRHKTMIYIGQTVGCSVSQQMDGGSRALEGGILCNETAWDAIRAAVRAGVTIYSIDPRGNTVGGFVSPEIDGRGGPNAARERMRTAEPGPLSVMDVMRVMADSTGGFVVTGTNAFNAPLDRIVRENSSYYLLGYASTNDRPDGKFRKTDVKVALSGAQLFYRPGYLARRQ